MSNFRRAINHARLQLWRKSGKVPPVRHCDGYEYGFATLRRGPVIIAFVHTGPFEAPAHLLRDAYPQRNITVITDDVDAAPATTLVTEFGWRAVSIYDDNVGAVALETLLDGDVLVVSTDVLPLGQESVTVEFLGALHRLPSGPAHLAMATGATILPVASYLCWRGARVVIRPPLYLSSGLDAAGLTQDLADEMTDFIDGHLDEWFPAFPLQPALSAPIGL